MNETENKNEETEYNDIESLAAYLHSGKMQEIKAAEERAEMGLPPEPEDTAGGSELEGVLFTAEGRKRQSTGATGLLIKDLSDAISDIDDDAGSAPASPARPAHITPDPSIPANPMMKASGKSPAERQAEHGTPRKRTGNTSLAETAKNKLGSVVSSAKSKIEDIKESLSSKNKDEDGSPTEQTRPEKAEHIKHEKHAAVHSASNKPTADDDIPALAASLSAALGVEAQEIVHQNKNALPPEDIPEVFDVEEGSAEEKSFDRTATRLMNAVNDPQARSVSMKEDVDTEEEEERAEKIMAARMRLNYERQKQGTRTLAYILIALLLCAAILGVSAYASTYLVKWALDFTGVAASDFKVDVTIPDDADIETVAAILSENNIISDARFFKMYADFADKLKKNKDGESKEFISGKFTVSSTMSYSTLLNILRTKQTVRKTVNVRIIEGMTAREIGALLEENNVCFAEDFEKYYKNIQNTYDFERRVKENSLKFDQLEGYLFPDTYEFYVVSSMENGIGRTDDEAYESMKKESEDNAEEAAYKMYSNFNSKITRSMYKRMGEMHFTLDDTIAIASLVQKEAASEEDMELVASVFLNRIRNSETFPFLQSDVSTLYIENDIKPNFVGSESSMQRVCNAYNTYSTEGIPPGGLCNPGLAAINAVLYAPATEYFYFCANKETGEIYYAATHEEHEQNLIRAGLTVDDSGEALPYGEGE